MKLNDTCVYMDKFIATDMYNIRVMDPGVLPRDDHNLPHNRDNEGNNPLFARVVCILSHILNQYNIVKV